MTAYFTLTVADDGIAIVRMDDPRGSSNTMTEAYKAGFDALLDELEAVRESIRGVVFSSAKKTFLAGGDLDAMQARACIGASAVLADAQRLTAQLRRLELLGRPVVAAIAGSALGGGMELALACHGRICVESAALQLGFPEVTLGLMPGGGGVVRTVKRIGLLKAVPVLADGVMLSPSAAMALGLVDELVGSSDELIPAAIDWIARHPQACAPWDVKGYKVPGGGLYEGDLHLRLGPLTASHAKKSRGLLPATAAILGCAAEASMVAFDAAQAAENRAFTELAMSKVASNLVALNFFDRREIRRGVSRPAAGRSAPIRRVGVLGAGMMGAGIAWSHALAGIDVQLKDVTLAAAQRGRDRLLTLASRLGDDAGRAVLARIEASDGSSPFEGCELIIEAVFEDPTLKARMTQAHEHALPLDALFATNTSTLPVTGLAEAAAHAERFIGLHFFSPVDRMQLVEIIRGAKTSDATIARAFDHVLAIGKTPIVVNDSRGFFASRVFQKFIYEAAAMVGEGLPAALIENAALQAGYPASPLSLLDDTTLSLSKTVIAQTRAGLAAEGKFLADHPGEGVIVRMVDEFARAGRSTGGGFYDHPDGGRKRLWRGLAEAFGGPGVLDATDDGIGSMKLAASLGERFLVAQAVDAARCVEEGVINSAAEANVGSVLGIGFPLWTGGILRYIDGCGTRAFVARADALRAAHGERFAVPAALRRLAETDAPFMARRAGAISPCGGGAPPS